MVAEQRQIVDVPVATESEAIRVLWNTYGLGIEIKGWLPNKKSNVLEEVQDEQVDSNESDDSNELGGASGSTQGDILQANE
ncbi:MAG: hypothetical protein GX896_07135 [Clostridiales bacterium]|nr:hypothetical protein [Clostridiales bacterium]